MAPAALSPDGCAQLMPVAVGAALAVLAVMAVWAPVARADVAIGDEQIVVTDDEGARTVVQRRPFKMSFVDSSGRTVLEHLDGAVPGAEANVDETPFDSVPENAHYAPLSFQLGADKSTQHPGGLWTGNILAGVRAGVVHAATEVLSAERRGDVLSLEVATTSPAHPLRVTVQPDTGSAFRVRANVPYGAGVAAFQDSFKAGSDEGFHGFGGRHNRLDQRGNDFYNWVEEEAFGAAQLQPVVDFVPGAGGDRYLFPNGPTQAYYVQNIFISSQPYGFMLNQTELSRWRMAADRPDAWQVAVRADEMDYTVAVGDGETAIRSLTEISGRHRVNPEWAMGPNVKRNVQQGEDDPQSQRRKIEADIERIRKTGLRLDAYTYESWDSLAAVHGDDWVRSVNQRLKAMGIRPIGYLRAYVNDDGNFDRDGTFLHAVQNGLCTRTPGGSPFLGVALGPACLLDFTNPRTRDWWERRKLRYMLSLGFDGFMQDFGEQVHEDMRFHDGSTGTEMHNRYPTLFHRTTRRMLDEWESEHPDRGEIWMYTRSGFSGYSDDGAPRQKGSAAWESANFPGDETADWQRSLGLPSLTTDMLNRAVGGAYGFTTDIGGYFDSFSSDVLDEELFTRWMEWSTLTPFFRLHNSCCTNGTRMPWHFEHGVANWNRLSRLHEQAVPYMRELWRRAQTTGVPITRPMWLAAPGDAEARKQDQQWMLGEDVLVAPVVTKGATTRKVYFPGGCWTDGDTAKRVTTQRGYVEVPAPLGDLPWFVRCGARPFRAAATGRPTVAARRCGAGRGFHSTSVRARGRGLVIDFRRRLRRPVAIDVFQTSVGRSIVGERRVASFRGRRSGLVWSGRGTGGRHVRDGTLFVRLRMATGRAQADVRRHVVVRRSGRFAGRPPYYRRASCGLLTSFKLERPVFGGPRNRALHIAYRLARPADVTVTVRRGGRVVRRWRAGRRHSHRTYRLRYDAEGRPRGDHRVTVTAREAGRTVRATLVSRRL